MDGRKICSLVFSARQSQLPEIVFLRAMDLALCYQRAENERSGSSFSKKCALTQPKTFFFQIKITQAGAKNNTNGTNCQQRNHCPKVKMSSKPHVICHFGEFGGKMTLIKANA